MVRPKESGFSVTELLIVVAVIMVILAIAIPKLLHARMSANAASAAASMRVIHDAQATYALNYPNVGYSSNLPNLGRNGSTCESATSTNACLIDDLLAGGIKSGYVFDLTGDGATPDAEYSLTAVPVSNGYTGQCSFSADQSGSIQAKPVNTSSTSILQGGGESSGCKLGSTM
jgi:type IV pilus assembly protein PilA